ncbi:MAG: error-prone DNA polymerase [Pseudohongiellaceae bacterium]|jgi:error-prone DNA polymerase
MPPNPPFKTASKAVATPAAEAKSSAAKGSDSYQEGSALANAPAKNPYAELHCISNFTFLRGASFPEELVNRAYKLGYQAIAITDECSLSGIVRAHVAAKDKAIKLIIGSEFILDKNQNTQERAGKSAGKNNEQGQENQSETKKRSTQSDAEQDSSCHLVVLACNRKGYGELSHLISCARRETVKGEYKIDRKMLEQNLSIDCIVIWLPNLLQQPEQVACQAVWLQRVFLSQLWIGVQLLLRGDDRQKLTQLQALGKQFSIPLCAVGGVYMHHPMRRVLQDTITAIRLGRQFDELGFEAQSNGQRHLRNYEHLSKLYPPKLITETMHISQRCNFVLDELRYEYPRELVPKEYTAHGWLRELTEEGIRWRWPGGAEPKVRNIIEHELALIRELGYEHYFLTVHDLVGYARSQHILCQGRGSAANSAVCYCLGITEVDPARVEVLFERFISKERNEPPDIDVDFENARREEVIQYIYRKYGRHRAAIAATVITYRSRSAIRDVGKTLGMNDELINRLAKSIYWWGENLEEQLSDSSVDYSDPQIKKLIALSKLLMGFPRHLSQHVGGFIISEGPLSHLVPIENASMPGRTVIQWEKGDLESLGLLKIDVLALGMLTAIRKSLDLISDYSQSPLTVQSIPKEDPAVYDMMCRADTVGIFQIESRAQMSMLPRLKPRCYYDLVIQIAIVRPGPIQGDMVHPYLNRRSGKEVVIYPSEAVKETLRRTLGVPIFQEQVMQLSMVAAGFSGGEADQLRRAMAAWKRKGGLEPYHNKLVTGMLERGYELDFAEKLFSQIKGFGDYGFPESHSASFALIAYVSSWLKLYHPVAFCCALLNSQPMGFYAPAQLIKDARAHGVVVLAVDVNESIYDCSLEFDEAFTKRGQPDQITLEPKLRIGFCMVKGLSKEGARAVVEAREEATAEQIAETGVEKKSGAAEKSIQKTKANPYKSIQDLVYRSGINKKDLESLAAADALRALSGDRHRAFWQAAGSDKEGERKKNQTLSFFTDQDFADNDFGVDVLLPIASESQNISGDYAASGFTLRRHPIALFRSHLEAHHVSTASDLNLLNNEANVKVTGLVTSRQRPMTAAGVTFLTLEDESGFVNVVVWPSLGEKLRPIVRQAMLLGVVGHVQKSEGVIHLIAKDLVDLTHWLGDLEVSSRNFT